MLEPIIGSNVREKVLLYIYVYGEGFAREISREFHLPLDSVQKQLARLLDGGVLRNEKKGRAVIYCFRGDYRFKRPLMILLGELSKDMGLEPREPDARRRRGDHEYRRYRTRRG